MCYPKGEFGMAEIKIIPRRLGGEVFVPPSKSISHRAIIAAALAKGKSVVDNINLSDDIIATCQAVEGMGALIDIENSNNYANRKKLIIQGQGKIKLKGKVINCNESGSTLRFIIPVVSTAGEEVVLEGKGRLVERPLNVYYEIFKAQNFDYENCNGCLPLKLKGKLTPGEFMVRGDVSSQFITGLMFALPLLDWHSEIRLSTPLESIGYVDLTGDILNTFGIEYETLNGYNIIRLPGNQRFKSHDYVVEGDWSQAGFWIALAVNSGTIRLKGLNTNSKQGDRVILEIFESMGGKVHVDENDIVISKCVLHGADIDVKDCPDLVPYIAAMACFAKGTTTIFIRSLTG